MLMAHILHQISHSFIKNHTLNNCPIGWGYRRGKKPLPMSVLDITLNIRMVRFQ